MSITNYLEHVGESMDIIDDHDAQYILLAWESNVWQEAEVITGEWEMHRRDHPQKARPERPANERSRAWSFIR